MSSASGAPQVKCKVKGHMTRNSNMHVFSSVLIDKDTGFHVIGVVCTDFLLRIIGPQYSSFIS